MLFFRSEEALAEWLASKHLERGAVISISQLWELSLRWYENRMSPDYRGRTVEQVLMIFKATGLTSLFWQEV